MKGKRPNWFQKLVRPFFTKNERESHVLQFGMKTMTEYGYDKNCGHLFSREGEEYSYLGCVSSQNLPFSLPFDSRDDLFYVSSDGIVPVDKLTAEIVASGFLSCFSSDRAIAIYMSEGYLAFTYIFKSTNEGLKQVKVKTTLRGLREDVDEETICFCGSDCFVPSRLSDIVRMFPKNRIFVSPLGSANAAFGALIYGAKSSSRQVNFLHLNDERLEGFETLYYDMQIEEDCAGKMALSVSNGMCVINEIKKGIGDTAFYGRLLSPIPVCEDCICLIRESDLDRYFPLEQISVKHFAAKCVPVEAQCSEFFKKESTLDREKVILRVVHLQDDEILKSFMHFYTFYSGKRIVFSLDPKAIGYNRYGTLWRGNVAYRVSADWLCRKYKK